MKGWAETSKQEIPSYKKNKQGRIKMKPLILIGKQADYVNQFKTEIMTRRTSILQHHETLSCKQKDE